MDYLDRVPQGDPEHSRDLFLEWTEAVVKADCLPETIPGYYHLPRMDVFASTFTTAPLEITTID